MSRYDKALLEAVCKRDKCVVNFDAYPTTNRETLIHFTCGVERCDKEHDKTLRYLDMIGGFCAACTEKKRIEKIKETCMETYGVDHPSKNEAVKAKIEETNMIKYGGHPFQSDEVKNKIKQTNIERRGVEFAFQSPEVIAKIQETNMTRYGYANPSSSPEIRQKVIETNIERFGYAHSQQSEEVKQKCRDTNQERYNADYPRQNAEVAAKASKNAYKPKPFTFPCGNIIQVQGYEPFALELLVQQGQKFEDITTDVREVPEIWYETDDGKKHRYFCDIFLHKEDKIVEVKSTWTFEKGKDIIPLKAQACIDAGFEYEIWIFDEKKKLKVQTYDKPVMSFTEMLLS